MDSDLTDVARSGTGQMAGVHGRPAAGTQGTKGRSSRAARRQTRKLCKEEIEMRLPGGVGERKAPKGTRQAAWGGTGQNGEELCTVPRWGGVSQASSSPRAAGMETDSGRHSAGRGQPKLPIIIPLVIIF